ncbi:MAG: hypothetical protein HYU03_06415 [Thaumarchaeota archaeon]|nr:hypothetical protein [Nitrososphaerota archaeon]
MWVGRRRCGAIVAMVARTRRIAIASLFGVIIFGVRGFIPAPSADFLIGLFGATYVEFVNGLILTPVKLSFAPFSLLLALLFGIQVDILSMLLRPKVGADVRTGRIVAIMTISTATTGLIAYYTTVILTSLLPYNPVLDITILVYGVVNGALGGYLAVKVWRRNLRARFQGQS